MSRKATAVVADSEKFDIQLLAVDRWNATQVTQELIGAGLNAVLFGQGFASMSAPSKLFESLIVARKIGHPGNPVMDWMIANVAKKEDEAGNIKPDKKRSREKIDGVVATVMGLGVAPTEVEPKPGPSVYETRGILRV